MTSPNNQIIIDKIKSGELFTDKYQDACRQRKAAVLLERSQRECYYHPTFEFLANAARNKHEEQVCGAVKSVYGWPK